MENKKSTLTVLIVLGIIILVKIFYDAYKVRNGLYKIKTEASFYMTKKVLIDNDNCIIFIETIKNETIKICGDYEITKPNIYDTQD